MKKASDILSELGFREDSPKSLQEAFVRNLVKAATGVVLSPKKPVKAPEQLSFDFCPDPEIKKIG